MSSLQTDFQCKMELKIVKFQTPQVVDDHYDANAPFIQRGYDFFHLASFILCSNERPAVDQISTLLGNFLHKYTIYSQQQTLRYYIHRRLMYLASFPIYEPSELF